MRMHIRQRLRRPRLGMYQRPMPNVPNMQQLQHHQLDQWQHRIPNAVRPHMRVHHGPMHINHRIPLCAGILRHDIKRFHRMHPLQRRQRRLRHHRRRQYGAHKLLYRNRHHIFRYQWQRPLGRAQLLVQLTAHFHHGFFMSQLI